MTRSHSCHVIVHEKLEGETEERGCAMEKVRAKRVTFPWAHKAEQGSTSPGQSAQGTSLDGVCCFLRSASQSSWESHDQLLCASSTTSEGAATSSVTG